MKDLFEKHFPMFTDAGLKEELLACAQLASFAPETVLLEPGQYVKVLPLIVKGAVKVSRIDEEGNELLLYYIRSGQSCAVSLSAYLHNRTSEIRAVTTEETELILVPTRFTDNWWRSFGSWQQFAMQLYHQRFEELLRVVDAIAFHKMDERLAQYLHTKSELGQSAELHITHQEIANDLGTSREVVSRLLKQMERGGRIVLGRNTLKIIRLV